jgi:MFS family permease
VGGALVDLTGWQGLFWLDAGLALICVPVALRGVQESNDPHRSKSIDYIGTVLVAATLAPVIYGMTKATDWGWISLQTLGVFAISGAALAAFVFVEQRVHAPLVDLKLLRNGVLVGSTIAILIGAGTINGAGYLLSIYFQNPNVLDMSPLQAGLATLPMTIGLVAITPAIPRLAVRLGTRQTISLGFLLSTVGFLALAFVQESWTYAVFVVPLVVFAVGMGLSNGPASSASTACVSAEEVGAASGISNMARYVGAAVWTAAVSSIYAGVATHRLDNGVATSDALASGLGWSFLFLGITSAGGIVLGMIVRHRQARAGLIDSAAAAAAHAHTIAIDSAPTAAQGT